MPRYSRVRDVIVEINLSSACIDFIVFEREREAEQ
jgi:hypothetical protein